MIPRSGMSYHTKASVLKRLLKRRFERLPESAEKRHDDPQTHNRRAWEIYNRQTSRDA